MPPIPANRRLRSYVLYVFWTAFILASAIWNEVFADEFLVAELALVAILVIGLVPVNGSRSVLPRHEAVIATLVAAVTCIASFAIIQHDAGIVDTTNNSARADAWTDAVYFSIVTFTTPGFGDLQPAPDTRLMTAIHALCGYVFLGMGIGLGVTGFTPAHRGNPE